METLHLTEREIDCAALLKEGRLVAFPTETVYGLGAPIFRADAVASIFAAKGRPSDNPLIAHISSLEQISRIAVDVPDCFWLLAEAFFPGPLTVVLKRHPDVPAIVSAGLDTIAFRIPAHSLARDLIARVGEPLVAPSANLSGRPSPTQCRHVLEDFDGKIAAVVDGGKTQYGIESTVVSLLGEKPVLLRPGAVTVEEISRVLGCSIALAAEEGPVHAPGMKYRHYAPRTPVRLFTDKHALGEYVHGQVGRRLLLSRASFDLPCDHLPLSAPEFYASLRHADVERYEEILIYCDELILADPALMNRIVRAASS